MEKDVVDLMVEGERVTSAFRLLRDLLVFTDRRLILIDKQGLTGKKRRYTSVPYASVATFSMETAGRLDADAELDLVLRGGRNLSFEFGRSANIHDVHRALSEHVLG